VFYRAAAANRARDVTDEESTVTTWTDPPLRRVRGGVTAPGVGVAVNRQPPGVEIPLTQLQAVTPTRRSGLLVTWVDAGKPRRTEFAVAASRFSPAWNPENATARDSLQAQITSRLPKP
jgi:hypothetical protein